MGILTGIKEWFVGPARNDFYGLAKHVRRVPPAELAVVEAALAGGGPLAQRFVSQLRQAADVYRLISPDASYELRVSTTNELVVPGAWTTGWRSLPIVVHAQPGDRPLEVVLVVSIAGIVEIHGRALDGAPWPEGWEIAAEDLEDIRGRAPWMQFHTRAELSQQRGRAVAVIGSWLGETAVIRDDAAVMSVEPPATAQTIAAFEEVQRFPLPVAYRELLLVADGFEIGNVVVLGTVDAYRLDIPGPDRLVISPPDEAGALVLTPEGEVRHVAIDDTVSEGRPRASDLREWVGRSVGARGANGASA